MGGEYPLAGARSSRSPARWRRPAPGGRIPRMDRLTAIFDRLEERWDGPFARRLVASALVVVFTTLVAGVELARGGWLPGAVMALLPGSHFYAIQLAFHILLAYEVVGLVFALAKSVANAAGKQFEIFSLILLRHTFEAFGHIHEPFGWEHARPVVLEMLADAGGALAIFVVVGLYYRLQRHSPLSSDAGEQRSFIAAKKALALVLLAIFAAMGARTAWTGLLHGEPAHFFEPLYTLLVFTDVLVVLISLRYSSRYDKVFRNSGLAVSTVLLRTALAAPPFVNAVLGLAATAFALALTAAYNTFSAGPLRWRLRPTQAPEPAAAPLATAPPKVAAGAE